jgi:alpha-L-fucosidase
MHKFPRAARGTLTSMLALSLLVAVASAQTATDQETVDGEHSGIGLVDGSQTKTAHPTHPDAQWYPDAGFGLFVHWGIASVKGLNISWSMIEGLGGKHAQITPNEYFALAKDFNPTQYDPEKWMKAAKAAGFTYAVLTTRHHEGFAMWPSNFGDFDTKNYLHGRDLVKDYVEACRHNGLKVGLYYSPPDWYFERNTKNFSRAKGPALDADLKPRTTPIPPEVLEKQNVEYAALVKGQVEELLTRYGKIDLLWFDGRPPVPNPESVITLERIRELQPGIVVNGRLHGHGDFLNYERTLKNPKSNDGWSEFCNPWTDLWAHKDGAPFRAPGYILGELATCRSLGINYLISVGPMANGAFCDEIYQNFAIVQHWMEQNGEAVKHTKPLPKGETASVPATAQGEARYLFALPKFRPGGRFAKDLLPPADETVTLTGVAKPTAVKWLADGSPVEFAYADRKVTIQLPASHRTRMVDVVKVDTE